MRKLLIILTVLMSFSCKTKPPVVVPADIIEVPEIIEPEFKILSIAIIQADLVVTKFKAVLEITNPNYFAVYVSELNYELYGDGLFWASGTGIDLLHIPEESSCETEFNFSMNFINMSRKLLDDIIALKKVHYRFLGEVEVKSELPDVVPVKMKFERYGLSDVLKKK